MKRIPRTYKQYLDSSEEESQYGEQGFQNEQCKSELNQLADRDNLIELLEGARRQIQYYISVNADLENKLNKANTLYQHTYQKLQKYKEKYRATHKNKENQIPTDNNTKILNQNINPSINDSENQSRVKTFREENRPKHKSRFIQKVFQLTHSSTEAECIEKVEILKQSGKFVCSLYKIIDEYTDGEYFKSKYTLSDCWVYIAQLFKTKEQSESRLIQIGQILGFQDSTNIIQSIFKQKKQIDNLRQIIEQVQKKDPSILTSIYFAAKRSKHLQSSQY